jgi:hypothetical protein
MTLGIHSASWRTWLDCNINHKQAGLAPLSDNPKDLQNFVSFEKLFNSLTAVGINRYLGREGALYSSRDRIDEAIDDDAVLQQLLYAVTNPAKDGLTDRIKHWEGISSYYQLATGRVDKYSYINRTAWHRAGGKRCKKPMSAFTEWVELKLSPIPSWEALPQKARRELFRREVRALERRFREQREQEGRRAMTQRAMEKVRHRDRPKTIAIRTPQPLCHSSTIEGAQEYKNEWRYYLDEFYKASGMFLEGHRNVEFPTGSIRPPAVQVC